MSVTVVNVGTVSVVTVTHCSVSVPLSAVTGCYHRGPQCGRDGRSVWWVYLEEYRCRVAVVGIPTPVPHPVYYLPTLNGFKGKRAKSVKSDEKSRFSTFGRRVRNDIY